jgi:hypothetical protein
MVGYDFSPLSPHDFELLCRDLLQAEWKILLESFKTGKDGGIDFRYARGGEKIIVQCKRFIETGVLGLLRELRREATKVQALKPRRYILMTAAPLSDANKTKIIAALGADLVERADILGRDDLNNLLGRHPEVERAHYKLWLASLNVLEKVLHSDLVTQTDFQVEKIHGEIRRYVQGNAYPRALRALSKDHVVILSGLPGVGKTTLANLLLYEHLAQDFQPIVIREDFAEGKKLLSKGKPQVFYFDDFLGHTFLGDKGSGVQQREYRAIIEFIEIVRASKNARLILTTREHLLQQGLGASERLRHSGVIDHKVVIEMGDYTLRQRAEILYNHIFFSELPASYRDELLRGEFYFKILRHEKFNPRLIEWLSSYRIVKSVAPGDYRGFVERLLENPAEIWRHAYEQEISEAGRSLLLTLFSLGGSGGEKYLRDAFSAVHAQRAAKYALPHRPEDFGAAYAELHGAFLRPSRQGVEVINPSVTDWLNSVVATAPEHAVDLMLGAVRFDQIEQIWKFAKSSVGGGTRAALARHMDDVAGRVAAIVFGPRRRPIKGGTVLIAPSYEARLALLIDMADVLQHASLLPLIERMIATIETGWATEWGDMTATVALVRRLDRRRWVELGQFRPFRKTCLKELLHQATTGCRSDELREFLSLLDFAKSAHAQLIPPLRTAYGLFVDDYLSDEIGNCQSASDYQTLIDDVSALGDRLGVGVERQLEQIQEALDEYEANEEARADHMMDEYKERGRQERASDDGIRELFGSLRSQA